MCEGQDVVSTETPVAVPAVVMNYDSLAEISKPLGRVIWAKPGTKSALVLSEMQNIVQREQQKAESEQKKYERYDFQFMKGEIAPTEGIILCDANLSRCKTYCPLYKRINTSLIQFAISERLAPQTYPGRVTTAATQLLNFIASGPRLWTDTLGAQSISIFGPLTNSEAAARRRERRRASNVKPKHLSGSREKHRYCW